MRVHAAGPIVGLRDALRQTPAVVPALGALALFVIWAGNDGGYPVTHWAPGGLIVLALLAIASFVRPPRVREIHPGARVALVCLALYTALSFLSILWAHAQGDAWEGANRTLLYLCVFALFALWPMRGTGAALLLGAWTLAMTVLAVFVLLHVDGASHLSTLFGEGRLRYPGDYENASAATWAMVAWPALLLSSSDRIPPAARGVFAGGAVLLSGLALFSLSRGSLYSTPVMLVLVFALLPGRLRTFVTLLPVLAGVGLVTPAVPRVGDRLLHGGDAGAAMHTATTELLLASLLVALLVGAAAAIEGRATLSPRALARVRTAVGALALATLVAVIAGGWVAAGNPVKRVREGWDSFKGGYAKTTSGSRLTSGLGSSRYDFYRVALDEFTAHPLLGIGADNFQQQYLVHGRSHETPHYPHSVELRTLSQTGLLGALLALAGLAGALLASARALRRGARRVDPCAASVAAAALAGFAYWLVHGSFDWFWEFAGLGAPAFALLGIACALGSGSRPSAEAEDTVADLAASGGSASAPSIARAASGGRARARLRAPSPALAAAAVALAAVALAAVVSFAAPWLAQLKVERAARIWSTAPRQAYADLNDASSLNPLSPEAQPAGGKHRAALRGSRARRARVHAGAAARRRRRLREPRARGDRVGAGSAPARRDAARTGRAPEPPRRTDSRSARVRARRPHAEHRTAGSRNPAQSATTRLREPHRFHEVELFARHRPRAPLLYDWALAR